MPVALDLLNQLSIGHIVLGYLKFRSQFVRGDSERIRTNWLDRQAFAELELQQRRVDLGVLDREQFAMFIERVIGDPVPNVAFAGLSFWGSVVYCTPRHRFSRMLGLTPGQRQRARRIFDELHASIAAARELTHREIRAELSGDQSAILNDPRSPLRADPQSGNRRTFAESMLENCALREDQLARMTVMCALLRSAVRARHEAARLRFMKALTSGQRRMLEVIEHVRPLGSER